MPVFKALIEAADGVEKRERLLVAVALGLLLLCGLAAIDIVRRAEAANRWVEHTLEVLGATRDLVDALQDAETSQRGFLLTEQESFAAPYYQAVSAIEARFAQVLQLTADNSSQAVLLREAHAEIIVRVAELERNFELGRGGRHEEAIARIKEGRGRSASDRIRSGLGQFEANERSLLTERQARVATLRKALLAAILLSIASALGVAFFVSRSIAGLLRQLRTRTAELQDEMRLRAATETTLRQSQKMEAVGQLTGGIAHDFNNLLTIIMGNLDTLQRRLKSLDVAQSAPLMRPVEAALQGTHSAARLTHRLLAFSRQQALEPQPLDVNQLVSGLSELLARTVGERVRVETVLGAGLWPTFADPNQLENALVNMVVNARDAMPDGGKLTLETANAFLDEAYAGRFGDLAPGQYVQVSVSDTGTGIPPELVERIFEPFFTTKAPGKGTGLGLAMVHGFVKQSGGHVRVYSEPGEGTSVKLYLPRLTGQTSVARVQRVPAADTLLRAVPGETILVVEDNVGVREYAISVLEDCGYAVLAAADGPEALRLLAEPSRIDLVFTDIVLPGGLSGKAVADEAVKLRPGIGVLYTTGYTRNAIVHQGRLDAGVELLGKPYTQQDLARRVRLILDRSAAAAVTVAP